MSNDGKILENTPRVDVDKILNGPPVLEPVKQPAGTVERVLSMRDRNGIVGACEVYCQRDGHKGLIDLSRLTRIKKLLNWEETLEYFAMIDDSMDEEIRLWRKTKNQYALWRDYRAGLVKAEDVKKVYPNLDLEVEFKKPPLREPELTPDEKNGPKKAVYLPSKLDAWVQDALRAMEWPVKMNELAVEVCERFGIRAED